MLKSCSNLALGNRLLKSCSNLLKSCSNLAQILLKFETRLFFSSEFSRILDVCSNLAQILLKSRSPVWPQILLKSCSTPKIAVLPDAQILLKSCSGLEFCHFDCLFTFQLDVPQSQLSNFHFVSHLHQTDFGFPEQTLNSRAVFLGSHVRPRFPQPLQVLAKSTARGHLQKKNPCMHCGIVRIQKRYRAQLQTASRTCQKTNHDVACI